MRSAETEVDEPSAVDWLLEKPLVSHCAVECATWLNIASATSNN